MDSENWTDLGALLVNVLALPPDERRDFLETACGDDPARRAEVEALLAAYDEAPAFFNGLGKGITPGRSPDEEAGDFTPDPHLLIGRTVAHYRVVEHLGGGGMGVVYKAEDTRLGRTVALKFLPPMWSRDEHARRRFMQEARAVSALDHPNICTIYEVNETGEGQVFMAMACYDGQTLKQHIDQGPIPLEEALDIALQIAEGLAQAHAQGIIHRDVKPANIMITHEGRIKILDFGLAKLAGAAQITRTGATLGTVAYMAPEQARGLPVDHRADIWALGAVLYEMVAGQRAFPGDYPQAVIYALLNTDPRPVSGLRPGLPMQLSQLLDRALARDPDARYQRMPEFIADLRAVQQRNAARSMVERDVLPAPDHRPAGDVPLSPPETDSVKILVVDDEPELELLIRQKFRRKIRTQEWVFTFASDGREALTCLESDPELALILTDLNMPGMDGMTLLTRLADFDRPTKTVVVSAYGDLRNIRTAMNRGAFDFVTKPIDFQDFETTIEKTRQELLAYRQATEAQRQVAALQQELEVARRIQEAILPLPFPPRDDLDLYAFTSTAQNVSGTSYDYFFLDDDRVAILMGDVSGKGVSAALFMTMCQMFLRGIATQGEPPGACLSAMNRLLFPEGFPDRHVTLFYGVLDLRSGVLSFANAGHPPPYILRPDATIAPLDGADGPIWQHRDDPFHTRSFTFRPGEGLFLYSGGVVEAINTHGQPFTSERLATHLREVHDAPPARIIRAIVRTIIDHTDDAPLTEDLTVLALRYIGP